MANGQTMTGTDGLTLPNNIPMSTALLPMNKEGASTRTSQACRRTRTLCHGGEKYDLVTADGACDVNHERLEEDHLGLLVAQTLCAFSILDVGGYAIVKFFEGADVRTRRWIAWMAQSFRRVSIVKPTSSRATNSELYCVGTCFLATPHDIQSVSDLSDIFTSQGWDKHARDVLGTFHSEQARALRVFRRRSHVSTDRANMLKIYTDLCK